MKPTKPKAPGCPTGGDGGASTSPGAGVGARDGDRMCGG
ncbi:hypothetical protein SMCF_1634, partial [Streptomyces coelicoflavus ZG0656]